jgi:hypothetical protein
MSSQPDLKIIKENPPPKVYSCPELKFCDCYLCYENKLREQNLLNCNYIESYYF